MDGVIIVANDIQYEEHGGDANNNALGRGGFGIVRKGHYRGQAVAVKKMTVADPHGVDSIVRARFFLTEALNMYKLSHPRIVKFMGFIMEEMAIVMEFMDQGNLEEYIAKNNSIPWSQRYMFMFDIADGMDYLHSKQDATKQKKPVIFHQDLKSANVLLTIEQDTLRAKISDFGFSKNTQESHIQESTTPIVTDSKTSTSLSHSASMASSKQSTNKHESVRLNTVTHMGGTIIYMAPELFKKNAKFNAACDVYSYGVILMELCTLLSPHKAMDSPHLKLSAMPKLPDSLKDVTMKCIHLTPSSRPSFTKIVTLLETYKQDIELCTSKGLRNNELHTEPKYLPSTSSFKDSSRMYTCSVDTENASDSKMRRPDSTSKWKIRWNTERVRRHRRTISILILLFVGVIIFLIVQLTRPAVNPPNALLAKANSSESTASPSISFNTSSTNLTVSTAYTTIPPVTSLSSTFTSWGIMDDATAITSTTLSTATISSTTRTLQPTSSPESVVEYCPSVNDLRIAYGSPKLFDGGWNITASSGVTTRASFNLLGGSVEFDVDFSGTNPGIAANLYTISPSNLPLTGYDNSLYCDSAKPGDKFCIQIDWLRTKGACGAISNIHTIPGEGVSTTGCNAWGCLTTHVFRKTKFHFKISHTMSGAFTIERDGEIVQSSSFYPKPLTSDHDIIRKEYEAKGAVIYSSQYNGWTPTIGAECPEVSNKILVNSSYSISNLVIRGRLVQGQAPTLCSEIPSTTSLNTATMLQGILISDSVILGPRTTGTANITLPTPSFEHYCPTVNDLRLAYGTPLLVDGGWTINESSAAATKASFNLLGGSVEFDVDYSGMNPGVSANTYTISPSNISDTGFTNSEYCDSVLEGNKFCPQIAWLRTKGGCGAATNIHTIPGEGFSATGCNSWGCIITYPFQQAKFHVKIVYDINGNFTITRDGHVIDSLSTNPTPLASDYAIIRDAYETKGAVIYSSQFLGWTPTIGAECPEVTNPIMANSSYTVSNLVIRARVVQGPTPSLCSPSPTVT